MLINTPPVIGILFFGGEAFDVLVVYWLENGVIGLFNYLKIAAATQFRIADGRLF